ncbi:dihydrolipoamide acetyltransferase family protein [Chloroflexota bacterium]
MPKLGMGTQPLLLVEWKAQEGDWVEKGSLVLIVETEKVTYAIEADTSGFLHILIEEGMESPIGSIAGFIAETEEELQQLQEETQKHKLVTSRGPGSSSTIREPELVSSKYKGERVLISPVARKMAEEHMIDINSLAGTGPGGRIVREDIEKEIIASNIKEEDIKKHQGKKVKHTIQLKGMRRTIAERMLGSLSISAQLTIMGEIDMFEMVKLREGLLARESELGTKITYTDLIVYTVAKALKEHPLVNSSIIDGEIKVWDDINIGVAVALENGLVVPVIKSVDKKSLAEISQTLKDLAEKARQMKLKSEDMQDGTFTVTNLGALNGGYRFETVIINQPESAIMGTGGITDRVVARNGEIVIRPIMTYYFTYDHRVLDGARAAEFIATVVRLLQTPALELFRIRNSLQNEAYE